MNGISQDSPQYKKLYTPGRPRVKHEVHHEYEPKGMSLGTIAAIAAFVVQFIGVLVVGSIYVGDINTRVETHQRRLDKQSEWKNDHVDNARDELDRIETGIQQNYVNIKDLESLEKRMDRSEERDQARFVRIENLLNEILKRQDVYLNEQR